MQKNITKLVSIRTMDAWGDRKLATRGAMPLSEEALPTRASVRSGTPHSSFGRSLSVKIAKRWLRSQVGRPWDSVYSELKGMYKTNSKVAYLLMERLLWQVERECILDGDGKVMTRGISCLWPVTGLYVHPRTKLLCFADVWSGSAKARKEHKEKTAKDLAQHWVRVSATHQLHKVKGVWYWVELAEITPAILTGESNEFYRPDTVCKDVLTGEWFFTVPFISNPCYQLKKVRGTPPMYAKRKWQASHQDIRRYVEAELLAA